MARAIQLQVTYPEGSEDEVARRLFAEQPAMRATLARLARSLVLEHELAEGRVVVVGDVAKDRLADAVRDLGRP